MPVPIILEGNKWNNEERHESTLSFEGVKNLVLRICDEVPGMDNPPVGMPPQLKRLSTVLRGEDPNNPPVIIARGIHQADELHFTLTCKVANQGAFHIYLAKGDAQTVYTKPLDGGRAKANKTEGKVVAHTLYKYKPVGITLKTDGGTVLERWPAVFPLNSYPGRERGNSFSKVNKAQIAGRKPTTDEINAGKLIDPPSS